MKIQNLLILVAILGGVFYFSNQTSVEKKGQVRHDIAINQKALSSAKSIVIQGGDEKAELRLNGTSWVVASSEDYPADFSKISSMLFSLERLKLGNPVSQSPAKHAEFKLDTKKSADSKEQAKAPKKELPQTVTLLDEAGKQLVQLVLGKSRAMVVPPEGGFFKPGGQYFRIEGNRQVNANAIYISPEPLKVSYTAADWLKVDTLNFLAKRVAKVEQHTVSSSNEAIKVFELTRENNSTGEQAPSKFVLNTTSQKPNLDLSTAHVDAMVSSLENFKITDAKSTKTFNNEYPNIAFDRKTSFTLNQGVTIDISSTDIKGENFVKLTALKSNNSEAKFVEDFNNSHSNWIYKIPPFTAEKLRRVLNDMFEEPSPSE